MASMLGASLATGQWNKRPRGVEARLSEAQPSGIRSLFAASHWANVWSRGLTREDSGASVQGEAQPSGMRSLFAREPLREGLELRVERREKREVARAAEVLLEVALELEHVAEVVGAGEAEAAVDLGRHGVVDDLLPEGLGERGRHLRAGQVLARDADRLADEVRARLKTP